MISDTDLKDWQMLTTPLKLQELKEGAMFSVLGDNKVFKLMCVANNIAFAETAEIFNAFALPTFMYVYPWVKTNEKS
jgi:hypothetical protein